MFNISGLLIASAWADAAVPAATPAHASVSDLLGPQAIVFVIIIAMFYLLLIRPQQQQIAQRTAMLKQLQRGDQVVTAGGVVGTIQKADGDDYLIVEIAEGVKVKVLRSTITGLANKPEAAAAKIPSTSSEKKN